jgi:hypothetical protein
LSRGKQAALEHVVDLNALIGVGKKDLLAGGEGQKRRIADPRGASTPQFCYVSKFSNGGTNREKRRATSIERRGNDPVSAATDAEVSATY